MACSLTTSLAKSSVTGAPSSADRGARWCRQRPRQRRSRRDGAQSPAQQSAASVSALGRHGTSARACAAMGLVIVGNSYLRVMVKSSRCCPGVPACICRWVLQDLCFDRHWGTWRSCWNCSSRHQQPHFTHLSVSLPRDEGRFPLGKVCASSPSIACVTSAVSRRRCCCCSAFPDVAADAGLAVAAASAASFVPAARTCSRYRSNTCRGDVPMNVTSVQHPHLTLNHAPACTVFQLQIRMLHSPWCLTHIGHRICDS